MRLQGLVRTVVLLGTVNLLGPLAVATGQHYQMGLPLPNDPAPNGLWFDAGCGGAGGQPATVSVSPMLHPGQVSTIRIDNLPTNTPAMLLVGTSAKNWLGVPLPIALGVAGLPGCNLSVAPEVALLFVSGSGAAQAAWMVPNLPAFAGQPMFFQSMFKQVGLNPTGIGASRGYATRIAPSATPVALRSSVVQHGITFQFAQPVPTGQFANGDWFVVGAAAVVGMLPACAVQSGRVVHGAMVNPDPSTQHQGYDSTLFDPQFYSNARNAAWNVSASNPLLLQPNQSLIKAISNTDPSLLPILQTCAVLTVLDTVPPQGSFRPPYAGTDHTVRYDLEMIDWQQLQQLAPAPGMPMVAATIPTFVRPWLDHAPGWATRYMHPIDNMPDYGRDFATKYNEAALMCNTNLPMADKQALAMHLVQIGIDFFGNKQGGAFWEGLGGHGSGRKLPILFAGALLGDRDMLAVGINYPSTRQLNGTFTTHFGEDCQTFYVQQTSSTEINWGFGGYSTSHLGMPEFGFSHAHYPDNDVVGWTTNSYRLCCTANAWNGAVLCARIMGLSDEWSHPALFDYTDRYMQTEPPGWTRAWSTWSGDMWDLYRPQF